MADLTFAQPSRRSLAAPCLAAVLLLAAAGLVFNWLNPYRTVAATITRAAAVPVDVTFARQTFTNGTHVVGQEASKEHDFYVVATVRVDNKLRIPIFLKDLSATFIPSSGGELHASAIEKQDRAQVLSAFPSLKPVAGDPLESETTIAPGHAAEGTVLLQLPISESDWTQRNAAALTLDFYHQPSITLTIPKTQPQPPESR